MRLTAELITGASVYMNPIKQREINLRGQRARRDRKGGEEGAERERRKAETEIRLQRHRALRYIEIAAAEFEN
jgi:hypothetical protein